jgi:iron complex transport system ATP-binding protein
MIDLQNISVRLQHTPILKDVTLSLATGEQTCILGPNGCGKTTLLKTMAGLLPYEGSVKIDNQEVKRQKRKVLAQKVAMMSQFTTVAFDYTVYETILMGCYHQQQQRLFPTVSKADQERVFQCLKMTGLFDLKDKIVNRLSGGQQQRVFLAKVFVQDPEIILLDEPNNHLDIRYQKELIQQLKEWGKAQNKTIIGVFHDIRLALTLSQQVVFMKQGTVVAQGQFSELATKEFLAEVFEADIVDFFQKQHKLWEGIH